MKKLFLALVLSLSVAGCATLQKSVDAISTVMVGVNNPIGKNELYALENSMIVAFAGLNAYKRSCAAGVIGSGCKAVIAKLQTYTRRIPAALTELRSFVKNNDQVNARVAYTTVTNLIDAFKNEAAANGVRTS